jgi:predicted secreted protein
MKIIITAAIAGLGLGVAGCAGTAPVDTAAASLPGALTFDCGSGSKLAVDVSDNNSVKTSLDGGMVQTLAADFEAQEGMTFKADGSTLVMSGDAVRYSSGGWTKECQFVSESIPAPKFAGAVHALTEADAGKTFNVKVGEKVSIALVGVPTAGYIWAASKPPAWVKASDGPGGATSTAQMLPGFAGGNHWEVVIIEAVAAGEGEIVLAQRRPWEDEAEPDADTFKFTLKAS